jgi:peptide/nickel transport system substrate-binding protein
MMDKKKNNNTAAPTIVSRREFLKKSINVGAAMAVTPSLISILPESVYASANTPQKGGHFILGVSSASPSDSLDASQLTSVHMRQLNWQLKNNLIEIDHKGDYVPELAESWEAKPGAKEWIFKLRKGVEFHNGKTFTAKDVIYSLDYHRGENSKSKVKALISDIDTIKAEDKYTVLITLKKGDIDFPGILTDIHFPMMFEGDTEFKYGTGGYVLESFEPGVQSIAKRNPNYWKKGRAHFDSVEILAIQDVNARTNALKADQVHAIDNCELKTVNLLKRVKGVQIIQATGKRYFSFPMFCDTAPFDNQDVRMALKLAIDREHLLKIILRGYGAVGNDFPINDVYADFAKGLPQRTYDPDQARHLMKKAGVQEHVFKFHAADAAFGGAVDAGVLYKQHAAKAGIKIDVVREPSDGYWSNVWSKKQFCASSWSGRATANMIMTQTLYSKAKWNVSHWKNANFDKLLIEARTEMDHNRRKNMYLEMQTLINQDGGYLVPLFADFVDAARSNIGFSKLSGVYELDGEKAGERWWFKDV